MKRETDFNKFAKESANLRMQNKTKLQNSVFISTKKWNYTQPGAPKAKHIQTSPQIITSRQELHSTPLNASPSSSPQRHLQNRFIHSKNPPRKTTPHPQP